MEHAEQKTEKTAIGIDLPIISGDRPTITLSDGRKAKSSVCEIASLAFRDNMLFVTIETKNSIYRDIPTGIYIPDEELNNQTLSAGIRVLTENGSSVRVSRIEKLENGGVYIEDEEAHTLFSSI